MMDFQLALGLKDLISLSTAVIGGVWALRLYSENSQAKRAALKREQAIAANREMDIFMNKPEVKAALRMIDRRSGTIEVTAIGGGVRQVEYDKDKFRRALRLHGDPPEAKSLAPAGGAEPDTSTGSFSSDERAIRDVFDAFLSKLDSMDSLIEHDVISVGLFKTHFGYWMDLMAENRRIREGDVFANKRTHDALWRYIRGYKFTGVVRLFGRYGYLGNQATPALVAETS